MMTKRRLVRGLIFLVRLDMMTGIAIAALLLVLVAWR